MAGFNVPVFYYLNIGGNFNTQLEVAKRKLKETGDTAAKVAKDLNSNQMLSTFEASVSILTQMGGTISQVGIIASTAARPLYVLQKTLGTAAVAGVGFAAASLLLSTSLISATTAAKGLLDEMVDLRKEMIEQGLISADTATNLRDFETASDRLDLALKRLKISVADEIAPALETVVNSATALVNIFGNLTPKVETLGDAFRGAMAGLGPFGTVMQLTASTAGQVVSTLGLLGESSDTTFERFGPDLPADYYEQQRMLGVAQYPSPEQLQQAAQDRVDRENAEALKRKEELDRQPGRQVLAGIAGVAAGGPGTSIFEIGQSLEEMQAGFDLWLMWQQSVIPDLQRIAADTQVASDELQASWQEAVRSIEMMGPTGMQAAQGIVGGLGTGSVSGLMDAVGAPMDPVSKLIFELIGLIKDPSTLIGIFTEVLDLYMDADNWIDSFVVAITTSIIDLLPDMTAAFATMGPAIVLALIDAAPILFAEVVEALWELPGAFVRAMSDLLQGLGDAVNPLNDGIFDKGGPLHIGKGKFLGIGLPTFHEGGTMPFDGLANLRKGEVVLTPEQQVSRSYNSSVGALTIHLHGVQDMRQFAEQLQNMQGPYGYGLSLTPRVS